MVTFPFCKINLGLHVIRKRPDGYHDIETIFYPVPWCDVLEVIPSDRVSLDLSGLPVEGNVEENLCMKAYRMLLQDFALPPVSIHLHKTIPTGAGLGGGSSDAAHMLLLLNQYFECGMSVNDLQRYASRLGSDCAFFVQQRPKLGTGRGEVLHAADISLKGKYLLLVKPEVRVATAEAYAGVTPSKPAQPLLPQISSLPLERWRDVIRNDFEASVIAKFPVIGEVKKKMYTHGAVYASMTGSGSAVYGIFDSQPDLRDEFENMTYWSGTLSF